MIRVQKAYLIVLFSTSIILSSLTYSRNLIWKDEMTLWEDVVRKSPNISRAYSMLAKAYWDKGLIDIAMQYNLMALKLNPENIVAHNNLGIIYSYYNLNEKALEHYKIAINLKPDFVQAHFNLGVLYLSINRPDEAKKEFETILKINPYHYDSLKFLDYLSKK